MMKVSTSGMLQKRKHPFLLVILSEHTWFQLILRILLRALGWKVLSFFSVAFQHSQPHRSALRGPAIYIWYFTLVSISLQSKKFLLCQWGIRPSLFLLPASSFSRGVMMDPKYLNFWTKCILFKFRNSRSSLFLVVLPVQVFYGRTWLPTWFLGSSNMHA